MSKTRRGSKGPGYDYGGRRPGNEGYSTPPGKGVKRDTHKAERRQEKTEGRKQMDDVKQEKSRAQEHPAYNPEPKTVDIDATNDWSYWLPEAGETEDDARPQTCDENGKVNPSAKPMFHQHGLIVASHIAKLHSHRWVRTHPIIMSGETAPEVRPKHVRVRHNPSGEIFDALVYFRWSLGIGSTVPLQPVSVVDRSSPRYGEPGMYHVEHKGIVPSIIEKLNDGTWDTSSVPGLPPTMTSDELAESYRVHRIDETSSDR